MLLREYVGLNIRSTDDRAGLGYGKTKQTYHKTYAHDNNFPYTSPISDLDDVEVSDDAQEAIDGKTHDFLPVDSGAAKATDRMYYAGITTKLTACFSRPDEVLHEISLAARDMTLSKPTTPGSAPSTTVGGFSSSKAFDQRPYRRTGTKKGWSKSPPLGTCGSSEDYEDDYLYTLEDIATDPALSLDEVFSLGSIFKQERGAYNE